MDLQCESIVVNPWMMLPFGALLAAIALGPAFFADWWGRHYPKVIGVLAGNCCHLLRRPGWAPGASLAHGARIPEFHRLDRLALCHLRAESIST